jgi:hypothetical protein
VSIGFKIKASFDENKRNETEILRIKLIKDWICVRVIVLVFNAIFNNISVISWQSVLLVEGTGVPGENHWPAASHWETLSHNVVSNTPRHERGSNSQR